MNRKHRQKAEERGMRREATGFAPHQPDMKVTFSEAVEMVEGVAVRFEEIATAEGLSRFATFLEHLAEILRAWPGTSANVPETLFLETLAVALLRTGKLRERGQRGALADDCGLMQALLADPGLPDELWGRWLDRRDLAPNERMRRLAELSSALRARKAGLADEAGGAAD